MSPRTTPLDATEQLDAAPAEIRAAHPELQVTRRLVRAVAGTSTERLTRR